MSATESKINTLLGKSVNFEADHKNVESTANPANSQVQTLDSQLGSRKRIPMSVPKAKLSVPEIPGFHLHWINDYAGL